MVRLPSISVMVGAPPRSGEQIKSALASEDAAITEMISSEIPAQDEVLPKRAKSRKR